MSEELEGKTFGHLKVIKYDKEKKKWKCKCDCGNITYVPTKNLKSGNTKSCGCMKNAKGIKKPRKNKNNNLLYKDIGQLRVTKIDEDKKMATCFCLECGKHIIEVPIDELTKMYQSRRKSFTCGIDGCTHKKEKKRTSNSIKNGERFGNLIVKKRLENKISKTEKSISSIPVFLCKCDCGKIIEVQGRYLLNGKTKSCGCIKNKNFASKENYKDITSTEIGKILYNIYKRWRMKFKEPTKSFKKNVIDRGIKFFPELDGKEKPFEFFYQWAIASGFKKETPYLERINYLEDFSSTNCYFISKKTKGY